MNPHPHRRTVPFNAARQRWRIYVALAMTIMLGLGSRTTAVPLPSFVVDHFGDALWTVAVYLGLCLVWPRQRTVVIASGALTISVLVELSQLLDWDWLVALRQTTLGRLALGVSFVGLDLVRYAAGALAMLGIEAVLDPLRSHERRDDAQLSSSE